MSHSEKVIPSQISMFSDMETLDLLRNCLVFTLFYWVFLVVMVLGVTGNFVPIYSPFRMHFLEFEPFFAAVGFYVSLIPLFLIQSMNVSCLKKVTHSLTETTNLSIRALLGLVIVFPLLVGALYLYNFTISRIYQSTSISGIFGLFMIVLGTVWIGTLTYIIAITGLSDKEPRKFTKRVILNTSFLIVHTVIVVLFVLSVVYLLAGFRKLRAHWQLSGFIFWIIDIGVRALPLALILSGMLFTFEYFGNFKILRRRKKEVEEFSMDNETFFS